MLKYTGWVGALIRAAAAAGQYIVTFHHAQEQISYPLIDDVSGILLTKEQADKGVCMIGLSRNSTCRSTKALLPEKVNRSGKK